MPLENLNILTVNAGSSSIKFAVYSMSKQLQFSGRIERIGLQQPLLITKGVDGQRTESEIAAPDFDAAAVFLISYLNQRTGLQNIMAIGHRVVHGMRHKQPEMITDELLKELKDITAYDPDHMPAELELIGLFRRQYPDLLQVACFDTAFHADMPQVARMLAVPRRFYNEGVQRYGFHGLSYSYLMEELHKNGRAQGRIILAHLGSGASLAAVKDGRAIDTSMGFTPAGGTIMGTRSGDVDPGVWWYIMNKEKMSAEQFNNLVNRESGLLGVSGISGDMQDLLLKEAEDVRAAEAVALFCYNVKKWIGAFTAALGGLDTLVFSGGIGERAATVRSRVCAGLAYAGIEINEALNERNAFCISAEKSAVNIFVIPTNEELMIAAGTKKIYMDLIIS